MSVPCIMGVWTKMAADAAVPFLVSARRRCPEARIVLFVGQLGPQDLDLLRPLVDDLVDVDSRYDARVPDVEVAAVQRVRRTRGLRKFYPGAFRLLARLHRAPAGSPASRSLEYRFQGLQALRYREYEAYVAADADLDPILISDVRDVVFQGDPFEQAVTSLEVFLESETNVIGSDVFNRRWIEDLYGPWGLEAVSHRVVSCSGVTLGARGPMLEYLRSMRTEIDRHQGPLGPHDQAVHNWLLHTGRLVDAEVRSNGAGRVLTMGVMSDFDVDEDGTVSIDGGVVPPVIHQYDRHPDLADRVLGGIVAAP